MAYASTVEATVTEPGGQLVSIAAGAVSPVVANLDAETVTSSTFNQAVDPEWILASSSGARGNVVQFSVPPQCNQILLWLGAAHTAAPTISAAPKVVVLGRINAIKDEVANASFPTWTNGRWIALPDINGNGIVTLSKTILCANQEGANKEYVCQWVRVPTYGCRNFLVPVTTAASLSAGVGRIYARGVA